jgi:hypothetical protein
MTGNLKITVKDSTGSLLSGIPVSFEQDVAGIQRTIYTNSNGVAQLDGLTDGYLCSFIVNYGDYFGYSSKRDSAAILPNMTTTRTVTLSGSGSSSGSSSGGSSGSSGPTQTSYLTAPGAKVTVTVKNVGNVPSSAWVRVSIFGPTTLPDAWAKTDPLQPGQSQVVPVLVNFPSSGMISARNYTLEVDVCKTQSYLTAFKRYSRSVSIG